MGPLKMKNVSDLSTVEGDDWLVAWALLKFAVTMSEYETSTVLVAPSVPGSVKVATTRTGQVAVHRLRLGLLKSSVQLPLMVTGAVTRVGATLVTVWPAVLLPVARSSSRTWTVMVLTSEAVPVGLSSVYVWVTGP